MIFKITQELTMHIQTDMTDRQVKTQKCDFYFTLTTKILGGIVDEKMQLITQNYSISMIGSVEVLSQRIITNSEETFIFIVNK